MLGIAITCGEKVKTWIFAHTEKDIALILLILLLALSLRLPFLNYPNQTLFDEVTYANFATHMAHGEPFFDIHPPLVRILFAEILTHTGATDVEIIPIGLNQPLGNFPYVALRFFVALFGIVLPLLIYSAGRLLGYIPRVAAIPALFVVFDNAFVLYSRTILPDTILLVFGLLGFVAALAATRASLQWKKWVLVLLAACALGLALSIKWIALGVCGVVVVMYTLSRMYREIIGSVLIIITVYIAIFVSFFFYFPQGGKADPMLPAYDVPSVTQLEFPSNLRDQNPRTIATFFFTTHRVMLETNRDPKILKELLQAPGPLSWPVARSSILFWEDNASGKTIVLMGNSLLWFFTFFALLFELVWMLFHALRERVWPIDQNESILLLGYLANYIPFFFINRPMFLYHYFTALLFLFLLMPRIVPRIMNCIAVVSGDRLLAQTLTYFIGCLILLNFFLLAPTTYGF